jgi:hypothetical protein
MRAQKRAEIDKKKHLNLFKASGAFQTALSEASENTLYYRHHGSKGALLRN